MKLDPKQFGLPTRTVLEQVDANLIVLVIDRKSRIIMADGKTILEKINKIKAALPTAKVALRTTAPVCSKTKIFFEDEDIRLILD